MSTTADHTFCPYKGLQPYTEADRKYFFGRTRDEGIIISNLYASSVTVFYGASGVGKSSVLLAGAVPRLRQEPREAIVIVFNAWQSEDFLVALKNELAKQANLPTPIDTVLPLDEFLVQTQRALDLPLLLIFDQFEEYFLYHPPSPSADVFESAFARVVNRRGSQINFFLSLREDGLSKLDRLKGRVPFLLNNMLRLRHLDRDAAKEAITKPLDVYNQGLQTGQAAVTIEPELVEAVLDDLRGVKVTSAQSGRGAVSDSQSTAQACEIETPLLQMVLTRLWDEEHAAGSSVLRLQTFETLGRAARIARTHLDNMIDRLSDAERADAAKVLRYMVTPSRTKIAQEVGALAAWSELPETQVKAILTRLSAQDMRILRTVQTPGRPDQHEIFHDVLAAAILDWLARVVQEQKLRTEVERARAEELEARKRARAKLLPLVIGGLVVLLLVMSFLAVKAYRANFIAKSTSLAVYSNTQLDTDPELSVLLAIEAVKKLSTPQSVDALKEALLNSHLSAVLRPDRLEKNRRIAGVAFSPDGKYVVTASWDSNARVWEAATGKIVSVLAPHQGQLAAASFSSDGRYVLTAGQDATVRVWENWQSSAPTLFKSFKEQGGIETAAFSRDGEYIVTAGAEGKVRIWEWKVDASQPKAELTVATALTELRNSPPATTASPPETLVEGPAAPETSSAAEATPSPTPGATAKVKVFTAEFGPDGKSIMIAPNRSIGLIWFWTEGTNKVTRLTGHTRVLYSVAFSGDGKYAISGGDDGKAMVWELTDPATPIVRASFSLAPNPIRGVAFSNDGRLVATASYDRVGRIWLWKSWQTPMPSKDRIQPLVLRGHSGLLMCAAFSPDGRFVVTGSDDGTARVWRTEKLDRGELDKLSDTQLLDLAQRRVTRQLTPEERTRYVDVAK